MNDLATSLGTQELQATKNLPPGVGPVSDWYASTVGADTPNVIAPVVIHINPRTNSRTNVTETLYAAKQQLLWK